MKKKHIIIIILAVLVLAGLFTIYKLPVKDSEAIDLDSDVTIIINSTGLNYIDGKAYPKIDTKMYSVKRTANNIKRLKKLLEIQNCTGKRIKCEQNITGWCKCLYKSDV